MKLTTFGPPTLLLAAALLAGGAALTAAAAPPAARAPTYPAALAQAKAGGQDIVVFQRGSDWNRLAETLYRRVWLSDEFAAALGDGFVLVAVDNPEEPGTIPLEPIRPGKSAGGDRSDDPDSAPSPPARLAALCSDDAPLPASEVAAVSSAAGATFKRRDDGAWLAEGANPGQDALTLTLRTARTGRALRLDFPTDPSLPGNGPGRASNGNFALSEVEAAVAGQPVRFAAAWASATEGGWGPWQTIDGVTNKGDNLWNALAHQHQRRTLLLVPDAPLARGAELTLRLVCRSQWGQHVPGCVRAAVLDDRRLVDDVRRVGLAQAERAANAAFSWWDTTFCPRVALLDRAGRAVAAENRPRLDLTPASLAARVRELRAVREQRDALWARAEAVQGPERAELLRQGLDLLGFANWAGNENGYKPIHDRIREADPRDESGAVRWLGFGGDPRHGVPWAEPSWAKALEGKDLKDADFEEALARIDKELKDPRNRVLDHERIQRIMIAKYHVFLRWPGQEERRYNVQREIAAFDPDTFWGIGARGELGLHHRSATPMLTYGWATNQVRSGLTTWDMGDTAYFFDHAGPYTVRLAHAGGRDALRIRRVALLEGATVLAEARPVADLGPTNASVDATLDFKDWRADRKVVLRVEAEAADGRTDSRGSFAVEPQPLPPDADKTAAGAGAAERLRAQAELDALRNKLVRELADEAGRGEAGIARILKSSSRCARLAQAELMHVCGTDRLADIRTRAGGPDFLKALFKDAGWMESFLASDKADWPQALENLYVLYRCGAELEPPLHRRLATALALQWGNGSRYRLVDRYRHILQARREGLLHVSFDRLDVRALRWAVPTYGTARDFQFLLDDRQTRLRDYLGAHGGVWYVSYNVYGRTVQDQWNYVGPWAHVYGTGTGNRPFPAHRQVGGVCGTVSTYGSATAQAHGIPSAAIGQPGHCAYVVRVGQEWPVGNSVTWPSYVGVPGWEGVGYSTLHRLYEPVNADRERFMTAARLCWLARLQGERVRPRARVLPDLRYAVYRQGVGAGLPDFTKLTPDSTGTCARIELAACQPAPPHNFGVVWEGQLDVAGAGAIRVSTHSDDGSRVLVNGAPVVAANCNRQEKAVELAPGRHALRVEFSQGGGALYLTPAFEGVLPLDAGGWAETYERAIAAQPTNYGTWQEYVRALESAQDVPAGRWLDLGRRAARALAVANEAGWAMTRRCLDKALPSLAPEARMEALLDCNRELRQPNWIKPEGFPYDGLLNWQVDSLGKPELATAYFGQLLAIHHSRTPADNWIFGQVLNWGAGRFAGNPATAPGYAQAVADFFAAQGDAADGGLMANTISGGIRKASESGDVASFRLWSGMAAKLLPALTPQDVHLNPAQAAAFPKHEPFPGDLLSRDGLLRTSSACQHDRPLSYAQVLSGAAFGGWFDTNGEEKPWAEVALAGEAELSGLVLVNRFEFPPENEEFQWGAPLKVSVSADGRSWTEAARVDKAEAVMRVDLQGKGLRARHVRVERIPAEDKSKAPGRLHFRSFLVYGKKLY